VSAEKRAHAELDDEDDTEPGERERVNQRSVEPARVAGKVVARSQGQIGSDEDRQLEDRNEMPAKAASDFEGEEVNVSGALNVKKRTKNVSDGGVDEDGSESPGSSDERRATKRRRKEEKRLRKEERRRRREEKHRRKEEKRASKAAKAGADLDDDIDEGGKSTQRSSKHRGPRDTLDTAEVYRTDDESEDEQKRIERELRNKALESLKAKKGVAY
jgi:serine/arginine repetitive matrix protein 1